MTTRRCPSCSTTLEPELIGNPRTGPQREVAYCPTCDAVSFPQIQPQAPEPIERRDLA